MRKGSPRVTFRKFPFSRRNSGISTKAVGTGQASQAMAWPVLAAQFLKSSYKESEKC